MGPHRLMCGDATDRSDVEFLMNGEKADLSFTDPPYNVNYTYAKYEAIHRARKRKFIDSGKIFNDDKTSEEFYQFLLDSFSLVYEFTKDHAAFYCCFATKTELEFRTAFRDAGWHFSQTIIWLKERIILALGQDYHRVYEPILFGWKEKRNHYKDKSISNEKEVWDPDKMSFEERLDLWWISRDKSKDYIHPTQKPVRLMERAINKNTKVGDLLYEPFAGSCSTLMACDQTGRRCYAMELDPKYCDVSVLRWERSTGQKVKLIRKE
jgi:DNA modification methylase